MKDLQHNTEINRAAEVTRELAQITIDTKNAFFTACELLLEAYENEYHKHYGFDRFRDWIEQSDFDLGYRQAYYYVAIGKAARKLGLDKKALAETKMSNLKEILSLDPEMHEPVIRGLLAEANELTVEEVKAKVREAKHKKGEEVYVHYNFKLEETVKEIVEEAFELARKLNGSIVDEVTGEVKEISNSRCLEFICASFLQDPNNYPENKKD